MLFFRTKKFIPVTVGDLSAVGHLDSGSSTWAFVSKKIRDRIAELRSLNDNPGLDEIKTAVLRGRIAALKELAALPDGKNHKLPDLPEYRPEDANFAGYR